MPTSLLSIYPALPPDAHPDQVREVYALLRDLPGLDAVELPLDAAGQLPHADVVLAQVPAHWDVVLTTVPGTVARVARDRTFGLAADARGGGQDAQEHLVSCLRTAARIDERLGRAAVTGVAVVSAPPRVGGTPDGAPDRVPDRLAERVGTAWATAPGHVRPLLEHCDAPVDGRAPVKGFLDLEADIAAVDALRRAGRETAGLVVNWGRSALERRSVDGPVDHLERARAAGVLAGLVLSGCSAADGAFGPAWADAHPPTADLPAPAGEPTSLLTEHEIRRCLAAAGPVPLLGVKFSLRPLDLAPPAAAQALAAAFARVHELAAGSS